MRTRIVRRFFVSGILLLASSLLALDLYVSASNPDLWYRLLVASALILALIGGLAYAFIRSFSFQTAELRAYAEHLLDPQVARQPLPAGEDDLGALARSLQRMAPRIRGLVENLRLESARREAILASMIEGVLAVDKDLRVTFCNNSFARALGATNPVREGMPLLELVRDPGLLDIITKVLAAGERMEQRLTLPAAEDHTFEVLAGPLAG